jgi:hypothetical protein
MPVGSYSTPRLPANFLVVPGTIRRVPKLRRVGDVTGGSQLFGPPKVELITFDGPGNDDLAGAMPPWGEPRGPDAVEVHTRVADLLEHICCTKRRRSHNHQRTRPLAGKTFRVSSKPRDSEFDRHEMMMLPIWSVRSRILHPHALEYPISSTLLRIGYPTNSLEGHREPA